MSSLWLFPSSVSLSVCLEQCEGGAEGLSSVAVIMVSWCRVRDWHVDVNELSSAFLSTSTALMSPHVKRRGSSLRSRSSSSLSITSQCVGVAVSVCANVPLFFSVSLALPLSLSPSPQGPCIKRRKWNCELQWKVLSKSIAFWTLQTLCSLYIQHVWNFMNSKL